MTVSPNRHNNERPHFISLTAAAAITRKTMRYLRLRAECGMWRARRDGDGWMIDLTALLADLDDRGVRASRRRSERPWLRLIVSNESEQVEFDRAEAVEAELIRNYPHLLDAGIFD